MRVVNTGDTVTVGEVLTSIATASPGNTRRIGNGIALIGTCALRLTRIGSEDERVA